MEDPNTLKLLVSFLPYLVTGSVVLGIGAFLGVLVQLFTLVKLFRNDPQKREVEIAERYADLEEVRRIDGKMDLLRECTEERARRIHSRIDPLVENTAHIKGQMESFTAAFQGFTGMMSKREK